MPKCDFNKVVSWDVAYNYHGETTVPAFSFPTNHEDLKNKRIKFARYQQANPILFAVYISHIEETFF